MDITSCLRPKLPEQVRHLLSYFGQRQPRPAPLPNSPKLASYQRGLQLRAWLFGPDHDYQPRDGMQGGLCQVAGCRRNDGAHLGLLGRLAYRWGGPGAQPGGGR